MTWLNVNVCIEVTSLPQIFILTPSLPTLTSLNSCMQAESMQHIKGKENKYKHVISTILSIEW